MSIAPYHGTNEDIEKITDSIRATVLQEIGVATLRGRELLDEIVERTGGTIDVADDPSQQEVDGGSLIIEEEEEYSIYLSPFTTPLRDNFTIAHELGHYFLHFFLSEPRPQPRLGFTRYGSGLIEWQANRFAASLLMPKELFKKTYARFSGDTYRLSGFFDVSRSAVEVRAQSLGLEK